MKRVVLALALVLGFAGHAVAQQKVGHLNVEELVASLPEYQAIEAKMQMFSAQLSKDSTEMANIVMEKGAYIEANQADMTPNELKKQQGEYQKLFGNYQYYVQSMPYQSQAEYMRLFQPLSEKVEEAIKKVGRDNGFTYILDSSVSKGIIIFDENGEDVMPLVKKALGL